MKGDKVKKNFLKSLQEAKGIISYACEKVGISRQTYYRWISDDNDFREACEDITEMVIDLVEGKLLTNINDGDVTSIIFYLKTKGKKRGYIERFQMEDISDREPVEVNIVMPNMERYEDQRDDKSSED
jgi:hypothetical protein